MAEDKVTRAEFEALEKVTDKLVKTIDALAKELKAVKEAKPASVSVAPPPPKPIDPPKPFKLEGVGTVTLRFAKFTIKRVTYTSEALASDPVAAAALYESNPELFLITKNKE